MEWSRAAEKFVDALSTADGVPGGGAAAAAAAAMGCGLAMMALHTTINRKATPQEIKPRLTAQLHKMNGFKEQLKGYISKDGEAYSAYLAAQKRPKESAEREQAMQDALLFAAGVPSDAAVTACKCLFEIDSFKEDIAPIILSDVICGQDLLKTAIRCCIQNIKANLNYIKNQDQKRKFEEQIVTFLKSC